MASIPGYARMISSLLIAAGSPSYAAVTSVCKIARTPGKSFRNSCVTRAAVLARSFGSQSSHGRYSRLRWISFSSRRATDVTNSLVYFFSSRRRHTRYIGDWSSDVCSSDLEQAFDHHARMYVYEIRPDWYDEFLSIGDEIAVHLPAGETEQEDDGSFGYFSNN